MINPSWAQEQLTKRMELGYIARPSKQSDDLTDPFLRKFLPWEEYLLLLDDVARTEDERSYGILRYTNLLAHDGAVAAMCRHDEVSEHDQIDLVVTNYPLDLAVIEWPFQYSKKWTLKFAQRNPLHLAQWFYRRTDGAASNVLFVVAYAHSHEHWRAKCDLDGISVALDKYVERGVWKNPKMLRIRENWARTDTVFHVI